MRGSIQGAKGRFDCRIGDMGGNLGESGGGGKVCVTGWRNTCVMGGKRLILLGVVGGGMGLLWGLGGRLVYSQNYLFAPVS